MPAPPNTDTGLTGIGEATLEWQERTVETLLHEWVCGRVLGRDPFDLEATCRGGSKAGDPLCEAAKQNGAPDVGRE